MSAGTNVVRIDAGSASNYRDAENHTWSADTNFVGGNTVARGAIDIAGTNNPALFRSERWGLTGYKLPVINGNYVVALYFAETYDGVTAPGQRVFGIAVQGVSLGDMDVFAATGGRNRATATTTTTTVTNGILDVTFTPRVGAPMINALEVFPSPPSFTSGLADTQRNVTAESSLSIKTDVTSARPASAIVDLEVYGPGGYKAFQQFWNPLTFGAGQRVTFFTRWEVPSNTPPGAYTVKVGVFAPGWGVLYAWNDSAATINVVSGVMGVATSVAPTSTSVVSTPTPMPPTPTPVPPTATQVPPTATSIPATPTVVPATATPTSAYGEAVLADKPLAYWRLDEMSGTTAADASGNGRAAIINGGVTLGVAGPNAGGADTAMTLDGSSGYVRATSPITVAADFTIEAWVKAAAATQDVPMVALVGPQDQGARILYLDGQHVRAMDDVTANWPDYSITTPALDTTTWHHVVATTAGGTKLTLYVDGVAANSATIATAAGFSGNPVIGWSDEQAFSKYAGSLAHVALYASALPADRVASHYAAARPAAPATPTATPQPVALTLPSCTSTLQSMIDAASPGAVLRPPACVYREMVVITKPLTIDGQGKTELRGSDVWSAWTPIGATWVSGNTVPNLGTDSAGAMYVDSFRGSHLEQVFFDSTPLTLVPSNPASGQFTLDSTRHVILGTDPTGHLVEVTTRKNWIYNQADNVTLTNMTFRHAASPSQAHAIGNDDRFGFQLANSTLSDAHGIMLSVGGGDQYTRILNNTFSRAGDLAIGSYNAGHAVVQGNTVVDNGWGGYDWNWQAGGMKFTAARDLLVDGNLVFGNGGPGVWCDISCAAVTYSNNRVHDNVGVGLLFEISNGAHIFGNTVWNQNSGPAIFVSSSGGAEVYQNLVYSSKTGMQAYLDNRPDAQPLVNNNFYDNSVVMAADGLLSLTIADYGNGQAASPSAGNHGSNNRFWYPTNESGLPRFQFGTTYTSLAAFSATAAGAGSRYLSDAEMNQLLTSAGLR